MKIAISGKMASGKSTLASYLEEEYGCKQIGIADKVKEIASLHTVENLADTSLLGREIVRQSTDLVPDGDVTTIGKIVAMIGGAFYSTPITDGKNRQLLQAIGHGMHDIDDNIWIEYLLNVKSVDYDSIVIDDLRYPVELDLLRRNGFITARIEVSPEDQRERLLNLYGEVKEEYINHPSEMLLDEARFDIVINPSEARSPQELYDNFDRKYKRLMEVAI